ncbi:MAG: GAF domain-containing protein [Elusimicrobia bacterium]|nr:GAF domain-containing protein [Elusimicrobiota bacterium]
MARYSQQSPSGSTPLHPDGVSALELFDIAGSLSSTLDLDTLLRRIGEAAERLLQAEASSIMLVEEGGRQLYFKTATGEKAALVKKMVVPLGTGIAGWVAQNVKPLIVNDVQSDQRFSGQFDKRSGFLTRSVLCVPLLNRGELVGVAEVLNKKNREPFQEADLGILSSLGTLAAVAISNARMAQDQKNFFAHVLEVLMAAVEAARPGLEQHPLRCAKMACALGQILGIRGQEFQDLYYAGLLHDIGYVALKNRRLLAQVTGGASVSPENLERLHPLLGERLLQDIRILRGAVPIIRSHHESFDGTGYPDRLPAEGIPRGARILALVEAVEELRLSGLSGEDLKRQALVLAKNGAGKRFDPKVARAFVDWAQQAEFEW